MTLSKLLRLALLCAYLSTCAFACTSDDEGSDGGASIGDGDGDEDGGVEDECEDGMIVDDITGCLLDDAFCRELSDGRYCTGPSFSGCPGSFACPSVEDCAPHVVAPEGTCEPAPRYFWDGASCVPQSGCDCLGPDCFQGAASEAECLDTHMFCDDVVTACGARAGDTCADDEYCAYVPSQTCGHADATSICQPIPTGCDGNYEPVCGCDGETYGNACEAAVARTGVLRFGECE